MSWLINETFVENVFVYTFTCDGTAGLGNISLSTIRNAIAPGKSCPNHVIIPSTVQNGQLTVTSILQKALWTCPIFSIKLPNTITIIKISGIASIYVSEIIITASIEILEKYSMTSLTRCKKIIFAAGSKLREIHFNAFDRIPAECLLLVFQSAREHRHAQNQQYVADD